MHTNIETNLLNATHTVQRACMCLCVTWLEAATALPLLPHIQVRIYPAIATADSSFMLTPPCFGLQPHTTFDSTCACYFCELATHVTKAMNIYFAAIHAMGVVSQTAAHAPTVKHAAAQNLTRCYA